MTRSRLSVLGALVIVAVGTVIAVGSLLLDPARAAVGPLPGEALVLPSECRFVVGLDVKRFVSSPLYKKFSAGGANAIRPAGFTELQQKMGLDPERDVDQLIIAGLPPADGQPRGLFVAFGRFDKDRIVQSIEGPNKGVSEAVEGTPVWTFVESPKGSVAGAVLSPRMLVLGSGDAVKATVAAHARRQTPLKTSAELIGRIESVKPGSTFWMVGDQSLLSQLPGSLPIPGVGSGGGGGSQSVSLPALRGLTVTGDLEPVVALDVVGYAADAKAAQNLADLVRGFVAIVSLQAAQKPELRELASAITVTADGEKVRLGARLPYDLLDALQVMPKAPAAVSPGPPAAK
jgi:hypothetical protein